jgi:hypothetical protein
MAKYGAQGTDAPEQMRLTEVGAEIKNPCSQISREIYEPMDARIADGRNGFPIPAKINPDAVIEPDTSGNTATSRPPTGLLQRVPAPGPN